MPLILILVRLKNSDLTRSRASYARTQWLSVAYVAQLFCLDTDRVLNKELELFFACVCAGLPFLKVVNIWLLCYGSLVKNVKFNRVKCAVLHGSLLKALRIFVGSGNATQTLF